MDNNQHTIIKVELQFNTTVSAVNMRPTGEKCYEEQMKKIIETNIDDENIDFVIVFPKHIKMVSGSYLLGMFEEINKRIGLDGINTRFEFDDSTDIDLKELLKKEIMRSGH